MSKLLFIKVFLYDQVECSPAWKLFLVKCYVSVSGIRRKIMEKNGTDGSILTAYSSVNGASQSFQLIIQTHSYLYYYKCFSSFDDLWK